MPANDPKRTSRSVDVGFLRHCLAQLASAGSTVSHFREVRANEGLEEVAEGVNNLAARTRSTENDVANIPI